MKTILCTLALGLALTATAGAHASTFAYSYTFADGLIAAGTVDGTAAGNLVTGLSNISLSFNGVPVADSGFLTGSSLSNTTYNWVNDGAVISFDGLGNNLLFNNTNYAGYPSPLYSYFLSLTALGGSNARYDTTTNEYLNDPTPAANGQWTMSAVPEPSTILLLVAGLGVMGIATMRRRSA